MYHNTEIPFNLIEDLSNILKSDCYCNNNNVSFELDIESNFFIDIDRYLDRYFKNKKLKDKHIKEILGKYKRINNNFYKKETNNFCPICLEEYKMREGYRCIECCNSVFHKKCIDKWFKIHNFDCPLCRHCFIE